jgi:Tol biopolymer transport system component
VFAISVATGEERQLTGLERSPSISDGQPSLSSDGRLLLFARDAVTPGQLWTMPLTGDLRPAGAERRIPIPGFDAKECGTPIPISAREMLFVCPSRRANVLWRGFFSGSKAPEELPELGGYLDTPELSRDGAKLVFTREIFDTNLWRLDLDGPAGKEVRRQRVLGSTLRDQNPSLAPDGAHLAFESNRGGFYEIWSASSDGSNSRQLTSFNGLTSSPQWSPDGQEIAFNANQTGKADVYVIAANGGPPRRLTFDPADVVQPVWSPDGKWIYFCSLRSSDREIWRVPAQGGAPARITQHGGFDLAFSPDGRWMYYSRLRAPSAAIWRMPGEGGEEKVLIDSAIGGHVFATSHRLYFNRSLPGSKKCQIAVYDLATGRTKVLATTDRAVRDRLAVTQDERSIYYTQVDADGMDLMLVSDFR